VSFSNSWVDCVNGWKLRGSSEVSLFFFIFLFFFLFSLLIHGIFCNRESGN
jgi:uncharacterized protein with PQ loop repeat